MNRKQLAAMHMKRLGTYNYARYGKSLEKIGKDAGLVGHNLDVYKLSMERRFPHHTRPGKVNEHYMSEWAERFRDGSALRKADLETLAAIKRAESEVKVAELKDVSRAEPNKMRTVLRNSKLIANQIEKERIKMLMDDWGCSRAEAKRYIHDVE